MGLLFETKPLIVNVSLAELIGLNEALVLQQIHYWLDINSKADKNHFEGKYWTYNTYEQWKSEFPFWSQRTVVRTIQKLRDLGILITGNFNKRKGDRTLWYSINYSKLDEIEEDRKQEKDNLQQSQQVDDNMSFFDNNNTDTKKATIREGSDHYVNLTQRSHPGDRQKKSENENATNTPLCQNDMTIMTKRHDHHDKMTSALPEITTEITTRIDEIDGFAHVRENNTIEFVHEQIEYDVLSDDYNRDRDLLDSIVNVIAYVINSQKESFVISDEKVSAAIVKNRFMKLTAEHIGYVLDSFKSTRKKIKNIQRYLITSLYFASDTMSAHESNLFYRK